jgi:TfoX/Sxy family transcriptional regulator of competence genes
MPYDEKLADRLREALAHLTKVEEKKMFRGVTFMVNGKMCVSVSGDEMMCRFDPALHESLAERNGFRPMVMKGRQYKGYGYVSHEGIKSKKEFEFWLNQCLTFNSKAKASKKPVKKTAKKIVRKK